MNPADLSPPPSPRPPKWLAALLGVLAAAFGLAVGELTAAASRQLESPVISVGDRFVDRVPAWLKELAIDWFGTNDKVALLAGIATVLAIYGALLGIVAFRKDLRWGVVGAAVFGLVGGAAALASRVAVPWWSVAPSLVGATGAAIALCGLRYALEPNPDRAVDPAAGNVIASGANRRRFLMLAGGLAAATVAVGVTGRQLRSRFSAAASRAMVRLPSPRRALPAAPDGVSSPVAGVSPFYTPNDEFYRIDTALVVPQVPVDDWTLEITGRVDRPMSISYEDLLERELVESDITMTCVSNEIGGSLVGTSRWLGVRLDDLLGEAGIDPSADQIVGRSVDGYTCGFPVSALDGRDALVAVGMGGEPLPLEHGFPARLIVPGLYGYVSATKWLAEIELTRFDDFEQYWVPRGWDAEAPIKTMSKIETPRGLATVPVGVVPIGGVAWAQTRGIERVELQIDDGEWVKVRLADELNGTTWRQWSYMWDATPGRHTITVRATDTEGDTQTEDRQPPMPNGASGHHQIVVMVNG